MGKKKETPLQALSKTKQKFLDRANEPKKYFGGKLNEFETKESRSFNTSALKAYLKGKPIFNYLGEAKLVPQRDNTINKDKVEQLLVDGYTDPGCEFVSNTPGAKRTAHSVVKDRKFQKEEDYREIAIKGQNDEIKSFNKGKKKAEKKPLLVFNRRLYRPGSKQEKLAKDLKLKLTK